MTRTHLALGITVFLASCTCRDAVKIEGVVVDLWENPVEGFEIQTAEGEPLFSDKEGKFELPMAAITHVKVSREGYIPREFDIEPLSLDQSHREIIEVIPEPKTPGYHAVGWDAYVPLEPQPVVRSGNELRVWQGIRSSGDAEIPGKKFRVIFHTPLKMDEVARLDIELHRLEFVESTEVDTVEGKEEVDVNLWVSAGKVKYDKIGLGSDDNYAFKVIDLPSGTYAFSSMHLLDAKNDAYNTLSPEIRKAHAFTVE